MKRINIFLGVSIFLLTVFSFLQCGVNSVSKDSDRKIHLLFEDLFKRKAYFPARKTAPFGKIKVDYQSALDSIGYFCYLYSSNLKIPSEDLYLHWDNTSVPTYPDSVKLIERKDTTRIDRVAYVIGVDLLEVNEDTTKLKVALEYSIGGIAKGSGSLYRGYFTYSFNKDSSKWTVIDFPGTPDY